MYNKKKLKVNQETLNVFENRNIMVFHSIFVVLFTFVRMWIMTFFLLSGNEHAEYSSWVQINFALGDRWVQTKKVTPRDFFGWSSVSVRNLELSGSLSERLSRKSDMTDRLLMGGLLGLHFISRNAWFKKPNPVGFWGFYWVLGFIVFFAFF